MPGYSEYQTSKSCVLHLGDPYTKGKSCFYLNVKKKPVLVADEVESGPNRGQVCRGVHAPLQQYVQQDQFRALERPGLISV